MKRKVGRPRLSEEEKAKRAEAHTRTQVRMPTWMFEQLNELGEQTGKGRSDQIIKRLRASLASPTSKVLSEAFGCDRTFFFMMLLSQAISAIEATTQSGPPSEREAGIWLDDPFIFSKVKEAIVEILKQLEPEGPLTPPEDMLQPPEFVGAANALGALDQLRSATKKVPHDKLDDDGVRQAFGIQAKRYPLIKSALGDEIVSRIGRKK